MISVADRTVEPIGTIQTWESETSYPDETPFVSNLGWGRPSERLSGPAWLRGMMVTDPTPILSALRVHALGDQMGRTWMPCAFSAIAAAHSMVSSVGLGAMVSGMVLAVGEADFAGTMVLPASGVLRLMNPGQITVETTPLWEEAGEIRLLAPGLLPRTLRVRDVLEMAPRSSDPRTSEALKAIADVGRWLNRSPKDVAEMCRFSLRALRYWGSGETKSPRPSTVRHLHDVHSFVGSLVRDLGTRGTRDWLAQASATGNIRLDVLGTEGGVKALLREANVVLFAESPTSEPPVPDALYRAEGEAGVSPDPYAPASHRGQARRPRRPPQRGE